MTFPRIFAPFFHDISIIFGAHFYDISFFKRSLTKCVFRANIKPTHLGGGLWIQKD